MAARASQRPKRSVLGLTITYEEFVQSLLHTPNAGGLVENFPLIFLLYNEAVKPIPYAQVIDGLAQKLDEEPQKAVKFLIASLSEDLQGRVRYWVRLNEAQRKLDTVL